MFRFAIGNVIVASWLVASGERLAAKEPISPKEALSHYVHKPDDSYQWKVRRKGKLGPTEFVELILTSQTWREKAWRHQLFLARPSSNTEETSHGLLLIGGGRWRDSLAEAPKDDKLPDEAMIIGAAIEQLKTPVAILLQVPHQPLFDGMYEDAIIAYTFEQYLKTGETDWPLLLPMVKSAVRALDAFTEYADQNWSQTLKTFTVTGASKRGWTTWLTGAVDKRATALAPMVIDVLNMGAHLDYQKEIWGSFSDKIHDYTDRGIDKYLLTEQGADLRAIVDPYSYREVLDQPKFLFIGTNDRYWPLNSLQLYWDDLVGDNSVMYVPNQGHSIKDMNRVLGSLTGFHRAAAQGNTLPVVTGLPTHEDGQLQMDIRCSQQPERVAVWWATSHTTDFRDAKWQATNTVCDGNCYRHAVRCPDDGYLAAFGEAVFEQDGWHCFLSTEITMVDADGSIQ